ncbi:MAG: hypothetical protein K6C68_03420 [Ruminococcus sp.]|nr:hypothetical protein [Ruminococcus sp.]
MKMTLILTFCNIVLLCLMILTATVFMPYRGLAKNFPKDVQEALKSRLDEIDRQPKAPRILGGILTIILFLMFVGVFIFGGFDGMHHDYTYSQYLLRFLIISFGTKAFDIIALDYFLLTKTYFFPHFFPETKGCEGWQQFGFNRKQHLGQSIFMLICCLLLAFLFSKK